jgi:hypothetical protein
MHTDEEIRRAAKLAEEFNPSGVPIDDTTDLRTLAEAVDSVRAGEARVRELVARARATGRPWGGDWDRTGRLTSGSPRAVRGEDRRLGLAGSRLLPGRQQFGSVLRGQRDRLRDERRSARIIKRRRRLGSGRDGDADGSEELLLP